MAEVAGVIKGFESPDVQALEYATLAARAFGTPLPSREPVMPGVGPGNLNDVVDFGCRHRTLVGLHTQTRFC